MCKCVFGALCFSLMMHFEVVLVSLHVDEPTVFILMVGCSALCVPALCVALRLVSVA